MIAIPEIPRWFIGLLVALVALPALTRAEPSTSGIRFFPGTFAEAFAKAKAENRFLFLDAYASWCGPCKAMDREVYSDPEVGAYFSRKFVAIKVDMEKGEGPKLAQSLKSIDGYPSLLFFGPDGYPVKTLLGSRSAQDFLAEARLVGGQIRSKSGFPIDRVVFWTAAFLPLPL